MRGIHDRRGVRGARMPWHTREASSTSLAKIRVSRGHRMAGSIPRALVEVVSQQLAEGVETQPAAREAQQQEM